MYSILFKYIIGSFLKKLLNILVVFVIIFLVVDIIENIAEYKVNRNYQLDKPKGVRGRSSDNQKIHIDFNWSPNIKLYDGLKITYEWIYNQIVSGENSQKFTRGY